MKRLSHRANLTWSCCFSGFLSSKNNFRCTTNTLLFTTAGKWLDAIAIVLCKGKNKHFCIQIAPFPSHSVLFTLYASFDIDILLSSGEQLGIIGSKLVFWWLLKNTDLLWDQYCISEISFIMSVSSIRTWEYVERRGVVCCVNYLSGHCLKVARDSLIGSVIWNTY